MSWQPSKNNYLVGVPQGGKLGPTLLFTFKSALLNNIK